MEYEIMHLPKAQWKGKILPIGYKTDEYYEVSAEKTESGYTFRLKKERAVPPITHTPEEYNFPDKLYEDFRPGGCAWGVIMEGELIAAIETEPEVWSNRLRINELWVDNRYQRHGIGHALMEVAKEQAKQERRRAVILETQSCNTNAIGFYQHEGFTLIGLDTCCYHNNDIDRREVRLEMGWFPKRKNRLSPGEVDIRIIRDEDWYEVERMTQLAFWNKHQKGCDEHYLVSRIHTHPDYLPGISRMAVKDGEIIGAILYTKSKVCDTGTEHAIVSFGPLCVHPDWQGTGVGEMLLKQTMQLAAREGIPGIVIYGEPDYYPRIGFQTCDHFGITTPDGKNFDAFMGIELIPGGMKGIHGKYHESGAFEGLNAEDTEAYNNNFPPLQKMYFPSQWD